MKCVEIENKNKRHLMSAVFNAFPECSLKYKIWCFYFNHFKNLKSNFTAYRKGNYFRFDFDNGISLSFINPKHGPSSFCIELIENGYLKNYSIKKGDIIIDAGAAPSDFTLYAAKKVGNTGKVMAFEPDPNSYNELLDNIELNNLKNIIPLKKALWGGDTTIELEGIKTRAVSLDNELKRLNISKVNFIKMDIEGAELEAIKGCIETLKNNKVNLAIASYHIVKGKQTYIQLEKMLTNLGYKTWTAFPKHLTTYASKIENK